MTLGCVMVGPEFGETGVAQAASVRSVLMVGGSVDGASLVCDLSPRTGLFQMSTCFRVDRKPERTQVDGTGCAVPQDGAGIRGGGQPQRFTTLIRYRSTVGQRPGIPTAPTLLGRPRPPPSTRWRRALPSRAVPDQAQPQVVNGEMQAEPGSAQLQTAVLSGAHLGEHQVQLRTNGRLRESVRLAEIKTW